MKAANLPFPLMWVIDSKYFDVYCNMISGFIGGKAEVGMNFASNI